MPRKPTNERSKNFIIILYDENEHYYEIMEQIKNCRYARMVHDKDIWSEQKYNSMKEYCDEHGYKIGDVVKTHEHIVLNFDNARWLSAVQKMFSFIPSNNIQVCNNLRGAIRYLIHADDPEKTQYSLSSLDTNMWDVVNKQFLDKVDSDSVAIGIINFINDNIGYCDETDVIKYLTAIGHPSYYPRYRNLVIDLLKNKSKKLTTSKEYKNLLNVIRSSFDSINTKLTSPKEQKELLQVEQLLLNFIDDAYRYKDK